MSSKFFLTSFPCGAAALFLIAGCAAPATAPTPAPAQAQPVAVESAPNVTLKAIDYSGSQKSLEALDRAIVSAGTDATKISAVVSDLLELLRQTDTSFAAQQAAGQRLGQLLTQPADIAAALSTVGPMLTNERLVNVARLALEPVPGATVDAAFLQALSESTDDTRLALIESIGSRRIAKAVPALAPWLKARDEKTANAAAHALGQIGNAAALDALNAAPDATTHAVIEARLACAWSLPPAEGLAVFRTMADDSRLPAPHRALALRGVLSRDPAAAPQRIVDILAGDDSAAKRVATEAISAFPAKDIAPLLLGKLASFDAPTKSAVLAALARQREATATPVALQALTEADAAVRTTAIAALGELPGSAEIARQLVKFLTTATGDEAKIARRSLARLNGPGVNAALLAGAEQGEPQARAVFIELIGLRNMTEALPMLWRSRGDADAVVRRAAVRSLGDIAPATDEAAMLAWTLGATDSQEITRAQRALVSIVMRNHDVAARDRMITEAADRGPDAAQLLLLPVLPRLGSAAALECAGRLALLPTARVATAATETLARWSDRTALPLLVATAEKAKLNEVREAAIKGAIGFLERSRVAPSKESPEDLVRLLAVATEADTRKSLLFLLSRGASPAALALAEKISAEPAIANEARLTALVIRANQVWPPVVTASRAADQARRIADGDIKATWTVQIATDQWVQADCKQSRPVRRVTLDQGGRGGDFPGQVEVFVTDDPSQPGMARATAPGRRDKTAIELPAGISGRYVIIKAIAKRGGTVGNWSIAELHID